MTYDEIQEWTKEDLRRGWLTIEQIRDQYIDLMVGGGVRKSVALHKFEQLVKESK